ncbi:MAG: type II secretion system protein, partial [Chthoniobacteraceae bacterium]
MIYRAMSGTRSLARFMVFMENAVHISSLSRHQRSRSAAFTLAEMMVAMSILAFGVVASVQALIRMNHNAALSRLQTGASTVVQNRIDEILNEGPFNPQNTPPQIPTVLTLGTTTDGTPANPTVP